MSREEKFNEKLKNIPDVELYDSVWDELSKLCSSGGKSFTMTVPVDVKDTDMLISELLRRFKVLSGI